jgi:hypothetical protein
VCVASVAMNVMYCLTPRIFGPINSDNPGKPYGTPDAFIAVCGDDLRGIRRRRKKRESMEKDKDNCTGRDNEIKPKMKCQGGNAPGCEVKVDEHEAETEGGTEGEVEAECTNILYRVHTGVTLVSEQEISLDLTGSDQGQVQSSEMDTAGAVTVTEQSKLFSFSFYPPLPLSPAEGEHGESDGASPASLQSSIRTRHHLFSLHHHA